VLLGETLLKNGNGHVEILAPLEQRPRQHNIGSVRDPGARFLSCNVGFDQLNDPNKQAVEGVTESTTARRFEPAGFALAQYPLGQLIDGGARYVRSLLSPPHFRRCKKQCFADRQTLATDEGQFP
jgi:hypothetical protein